MDIIIPNEYMQTSKDIFREINKSRAYLRSSSSEFPRNPAISGRKNRLLIASLAALNPWDFRFNVREIRYNVKVYEL